MIVDTKEVLSGPAGTAIELSTTLEPGDRPEWQATVAMWFLICPDQSPFWDCYTLAIMHLRDLEGVEPAKISVPGSTHEVLLAAYDADKNPKATDPDSWRILTPVNACEQIQLPDDAAAKGLLKQAAEAVVAGILPAEPMLAGAVEPWRTTLIQTSAHWRGEEHAL